MSYPIHVAACDGNTYTIYLNNANISRIVRNHSPFDIPYDELPMVIREEILIAIVKELSK